MKQYLPIMDLLSQFDLELQAVDYLGHVKFWVRLMCLRLDFWYNVWLDI